MCIQGRHAKSLVTNFTPKPPPFKLFKMCITKHESGNEPYLPGDMNQSQRPEDTQSHVMNENCWVHVKYLFCVSVSSNYHKKPTQFE
jgi:hypothetical protein